MNTAGEGESKLTEVLARALSKSCGARLVETHISWLILGDQTVYKLKKPVDLGFLDFSSLEKRRHACEEEVRLNRRTAPHIYQGVIPVSGSESAPRLGADGGVIDYAVQMRRFNDAELLDRLARAGDFGVDTVVALAEAVAAFHGKITGAAPPVFCDTENGILVPARENFEQLESLDHDEADLACIRRLKKWTEREYRLRFQCFESRQAAGFVRECHGDLHLGNLFREDDRVVPFDCIEFSPSLRWIDVISDIAFTVMDLVNHDLPALANRLLNEYLARTGDYGGLRVLRWYLVYRAVVRAKVAAIRADQDLAHADSYGRDCSHYLALAGRLAVPGRPAMVIMCGFSGTGKTTIANDLAGQIGAIHLRSDVERKRLHGLAMTESSQARGLDIYTRAASEDTFNRLEELVVEVVACDLPVIVDATFIEARLRHEFTALADRLGVPWVIVECVASEEQVAERLAGRRDDASEAGLQQYLSQRAGFEQFSDSERERRLVVDGRKSAADLAKRVCAHLYAGTVKTPPH